MLRKEQKQSSYTAENRYLVDVPDVDVDIGGTEQTDPQQSVEGPQGPGRRTVTSTWTGGGLRRPPTETQTPDITQRPAAHLSLILTGWFTCKKVRQS